MNKLFKSVALLAGLWGGIGFGGSASAIAIVPTTTYYISANCQDCAQFAEVATFGVSATLVLQNYVEGTAITIDNFVSLVYNGSNLVDPFSITESGDDGNAATRDFFNGSILGGVTGNIGTVPGANNFSIPFFDDGLHFTTRADGTWDLCAPQGPVYYSHCTTAQVSDIGNNAAFSLTAPTATVPEPGMLALMAGALGLMGVVRRRKNAQ